MNIISTKKLQITILETKYLKLSNFLLIIPHIFIFKIRFLFILIEILKLISPFLLYGSFVKKLQS